MIAPVSSCPHLALVLLAHFEVRSVHGRLQHVPVAISLYQTILSTSAHPLALNIQFEGEGRALYAYMYIQMD